MASQTFLTIDEQPISISQALSYLRSTGELPRVLQAILRQHVIEQELLKRNDLEVDPSNIEQAIINFRMQNRLIEPGQFDQWLQSQRITYAEFRSQIAAGLKFAQFKTQLTAAKVEEYFAQNKALLDRVVLSRIVVAEESLAEELMRQITDDGRPFEQLAKDHSIADDRLFNGMMGSFTLAQLPEPYRDAINGVKPGDLPVGPIAWEGRYTLLRVDRLQPAALEGQLKQQLQDQMLEQWVQEQLKNKQVKLIVE